MIPLPHQIIIVDYHGDTIIQNSSAVCQIAVALYNSLHDSILDKHFVKGISVRQQGAMPARKREREREREKYHHHTSYSHHICTPCLHIILTLIYIYRSYLHIYTYHTHVRSCLHISMIVPILNSHPYSYHIVLHSIGIHII